MGLISASIRLNEADTVSRGRSFGAFAQKPIAIHGSQAHLAADLRTPRNRNMMAPNVGRLRRFYLALSGCSGALMASVCVASDTPAELDATFDPGAGPDGVVRAVLVEPGGGILIGGGFRHIGADDQPGVARLTAGGALDPGLASPVIAGARSSRWRGRLTER